MRAQVTKKKANGKKKAKAQKSNVLAIPRTAPSARSKTIRGLGEPNIRPIGRAGDVLVIHREFITDLVSSATASAFSVLGIPINPGNVALFPWLSQIATNFESYVFRGLKFLFETDAPSTTPGTVLMAIDYDPADGLPVDKQELMSRRGATRSAAWSGNVCNARKEDLHKRKTYFVSGETTLGEEWELKSSSADGDDRLEDVGEFLLASSNCDASAQLGELYVEYEVELLTPDASTPVEKLFLMWSDFAALPSIGMTVVKPFGTTASPDVALGSTNPVIWTSAPVRYQSGNISYFEFAQPGTYFVNLGFDNWSTTAGNAIVPVLSATGGTLRGRHDSANSGGAVVADVQSTFYFEITTTSPIVGALPAPIYGYFGVELTGVGINVSGTCRSWARIIKVPDYATLLRGNILVPSPIGSYQSRGRKGARAKGFRGISCCPHHEDYESKLAGNAGPEKTPDKESSSSEKRGPSVSCDTVDRDLEVDVPSKSRSRLALRPGRFRQN